MGYEFTSATECQWYKIRTGKLNETVEAIYTYDNDLVVIDFGDSVERFDVKGSFLVSQTRKEPFDQSKALNFEKL
jgi:hypothetical protein